MLETEMQVVLFPILMENLETLGFPDDFLRVHSISIWMELLCSDQNMELLSF